MLNVETRILDSDDFFEQALRALRANAPWAALAALTTALALNTRSEQALYARGVLNAQMGDNWGAIDDLSAVVRLAPHKLRPYFLRGIAYKMVGELPGALADFDAILALEPNDCEATQQRAEVYAEMGFRHNCPPDLQRAIADYDRLLGLNPDEISAYRNRGLLRAATGDISGAIDDCRRYLEFGGGRYNDDQRDVEALIDSLERGEAM